MKKLIESKNIMLVVSLFGLYLISAGTSWVIFSYVRSGPSQKISLGDLESARSKIAQLPKTEECPINGKMYTEPERKIWEERRPITAIIENHEDSRPLEGVHRADVVHEAVSEGGVTRFLAVFYCGVSSENLRIAPVRSARIYFVNWAAEYGESPIFVHVGGANNFCGDCPGGTKLPGKVDPRVMAIEELSELGWRYAGGNDFDTTYDSGFPVFYRDPERLGHEIATEHTMVAETDEIYEQAEERGFSYEDSDGDAWIDNYRSWKFKDGSASSDPEASKVEFEFWRNKPLYDVRWEYDPDSNSYLRFNGGESQKDLQTDIQVSAKNVVIQFVEEEGPVDREGHMFYEMIGEGEALIFQNGEVIEGTWEKDAQTARTIFYDGDDSEIEFVRGEIWIEAVPDGNDIDY